MDKIIKKSSIETYYQLDREIARIFTQTFSSFLFDDEFIFEIDFTFMEVFVKEIRKYNESRGNECQFFFVSFFFFLIISFGNEVIDLKTITRFRRTAW